MADLSIDQITNTKVFQKLDPLQRTFVLKRANREVIEHTLTVFRHNGYLNTNIPHHCLRIIKELIDNEKEA